MARSRIVHLATRTLAALIVLALLAAGYVYGASEWILRRQRDVPLQAAPVLASPTAVDRAEGERMAAIVGCWAGCHGMKGEGGKEDFEGIVYATAPTLSEVMREYTDEELVRVIRYGVKRDGRTALGMISGTFFALGDADLARIIAHLRRQPASPPVPQIREVYPRGRLALALGKWKASADEVDPSMPRWGNLPRRTPFERGRYLVSITCTECHGLDLQGEEIEGSPALDIVKAYDLAQFTRLMRTGVPLSGRDLGIMSWTSRVAFSKFTDEELSDIHAYLLDYRKGPPNGLSPAP